MRYAFLVALFPMLSGCVAFAYPDFRRTPTVHVGSPEVRAFRAVTESGFEGFIIAGSVFSHRKVDELSLAGDSIQPSGSHRFLEPSCYGRFMEAAGTGRWRSSCIAPDTSWFPFRPRCGGCHMTRCGNQ